MKIWSWSMFVIGLLMVALAVPLPFVVSHMWEIIKTEPQVFQTPGDTVFTVVAFASAICSAVLHCGVTFMIFWRAFRKET